MASEEVYASATNTGEAITKAARVNKFDPSKENEFLAWRTVLMSALCTSASTAIETGEPTLDQAQLLAPQGTNMEGVYAIYAQLWQNYMLCQEEVWRGITLYSTFIGSGAAIALLETLNARFAKLKQGIDAFHYMDHRYNNKQSYAKQQDLIAKLAPDVLSDLVGTYTSPEHASDGLSTLFAQVWCRIRENSVDQPYNFCRKVLNAMRKGGTQEVTPRCDALQARWKVEDEGDIVDLLGVEFVFGDDGTITLKQSTYIEKMALNYLTDDVRRSAQANKTPCDDSLALHVVEAMSQNVEELDVELVKKYQSLVGALLYCAGHTRPDVAFAVGLLCRAMSRPTQQLYDDAQRVLLYLHRHRDIGLRFEADQLPLRGQSDSDWGVRHSMSGWQFTYSSALVSWGSKKQSSVALSSCEAEIMAASEAAKEGVYLSAFLKELGLGPTEPVEMGMDNQAAIAISYNPEFHSRTKHIDRRHFYVRECVENLQLRVPFVRTVDNLADFFTKPLPAKQFFRMRNALMNLSDSMICRDSCANQHLDRDGEPLDDIESDDAAPGPRHRKRGPRKPRAAARSGG